jgi:hypothetical protein
MILISRYTKKYIKILYTALINAYKVIQSRDYYVVITHSSKVKVVYKLLLLCSNKYFIKPFSSLKLTPNT